MLIRMNIHYILLRTLRIETAGTAFGIFAIYPEEITAVCKNHNFSFARQPLHFNFFPETYGVRLLFR